MTMVQAPHWLSRVARGSGPIYLAIVAALETALREGELQGGDQLPPQRRVAEQLGVDFTTVTRAYAEARARGLVEGTVGRGTFVRPRAAQDEVGLVDLSMNLPPPPQGVSLSALLRETTGAILDRTDAAALMAYHPGCGTLGQKRAAASWLEPCLGPVAAQRILICPGAQTALAGLLATLTKPGDEIVVEPLTYPGLLQIAGRLGLRLLVCPADADGLVPEPLERLCSERRPAAVYVIPTTQNPTAVTLSLDRRRALARIVTAQGLWLIEDDAYGLLFDTPPTAIAALAPDRSFYLSTLSKCLSPGLRTAFLAAPDAVMADRVSEGLRAVAQMPAPLMTAVVTAWIREGAAQALLQGVRREARQRRAMAAALLPMVRGAADAIHIWLDLPRQWPSSSLQKTALGKGLSVMAAEAFAAAPAHDNGVRISLGGPAKQAALQSALAVVAGILAAGPPR